MKIECVFERGVLLLCSYFASCASKITEVTRPIYNEASLKTFVVNTNAISEKVTLQNLDSILTSALKDSIVFRQTISFLEAPFSNPNSPYWNRHLYQKILEAELQSKWYTDYEKQKAKGRLQLLLQNNVGSTANDFAYLTPAGDKKKMYDIKANFLLLYFNNPECNACKEMRSGLAMSNIINQKIKTGELKILSIYTEKDEKLWLKHLNEYPQKWLQGRDQNEYLYKDNIYDLRAIPTLYLLDSNKKVLLKDVLNLTELENKLLS